MQTRDIVETLRIVLLFIVIFLFVCLMNGFY